MTETTPAGILHQSLKSIEARNHTASLIEALRNCKSAVEHVIVDADAVERFSVMAEVDTLLISPALEALLMQSPRFASAAYKYSIAAGRRWRKWGHAWVIVSPLIASREVCWALPVDLEVDAESRDVSQVLTGLTEGDVTAWGQYNHVTAVRGSPVALIHDGFGFK